MAKPSNTPATSKTSRRRVLQSFGYFTAAGITIAVPKTATAAAPLPRAEPSAKGRRLLALLAEYRNAWRNETGVRNDLDDQEVADAWGHMEDATDVAQQIVASPVETMADVLDRFVILTWLTAGQLELDHWFLHQGGDFGAIVEPVLALAGVTVDQCGEDPDVGV